MRVLFLNYEYPPLGGGAGNATQQILREYAHREGFELDLVTSSTDQDLHIEEPSPTIRIHFVPIGKDPDKLRHQSQKDLLVYAWRSYWYAQKLLRTKQYDLIHAFFTVPCGYIAMLLGKKFSLPYAVSLRGSDVPGYSKRFAWIYTVLKPLIVHVWRHADRVVANSAGLRELALSSAPDQAIQIIYNGVNTDKFTPRNMRDVHDTVTVLFASRLMKRKGVKYLIEAFSLLYKKYPKLRLLIAGGDGDASPALRTQVKHLDLGNKIEFTGQYYNNELPEIQHRGDIFVYPSFNEGMSNNVLEALAGGLPIIMTPTGGAQELVQEGENGFIVKFGSSQDIADKIEILLNNNELRKSMGEKSRKKALQLSWTSVADRYARLYEKIVHEKE